MSKVKNTIKRKDKTHQKFEDRVNEIDQMYDFKMITLTEKMQMKKELMGLG